MTPLFETLRRVPEGNSRVKGYQAMLDAVVAGWLPEADLDRGLVGTRGVPLPHETVPDFFSLTPEEQRRVGGDGMALYSGNLSRYGSARLCQAAYCWFSPLSRYHHDPRLLQFFRRGLAFFVDSIDAHGRMGASRPDSTGWAHGWDIEGLIYGLILVGERLDPDELNHARLAFTCAASRQAALPSTPDVIGSYGNQRCVHALGLYLYGTYLNRPDWVDLSNRIWREALPNVLDVTGQVIEQQGPCMHYSYTAFFYAWLNLAVRGDRSEDERVRHCLDWFRLRHTRSLYPLAGPSVRQYYETVPPVLGDLWPAAEQLGEGEMLDFIDRAMAGREVKVGDHGASILMWAILMSGGGRPPPPVGSARIENTTLHYKSMQLFKRNPLPYVLVRRRYQTHFNARDYLPFSGIQTWALDDEPPIIHPTPMYPSTTVAMGLDTARQGASHNWGLFGAGVIGVDAYLREPSAPGELSLLVARYDWLWRVVVFGELSTVILEFGDGGPRRTAWTLNRIEAANPGIWSASVTFAGRRACLHSSLAMEPQLVTPADPGDPWAKGVRQLVYDCGATPAVFAFSDDSFRLDGALQEPLPSFQFSDAAGRFEVTLDPRFNAPNPGHIRIDVYQLTHGSRARKRDGKVLL